MPDGSITPNPAEPQAVSAPTARKRPTRPPTPSTATPPRAGAPPTPEKDTTSFWTWERKSRRKPSPSTGKRSSPTAFFSKAPPTASNGRPSQTNETAAATKPAIPSRQQANTDTTNSPSSARATETGPASANSYSPMRTANASPPRPVRRTGQGSPLAALQRRGMAYPRPPARLGHRRPLPHGPSQ